MKTDMAMDIAMQVRCLRCLREQYALAVLEISCGKARCTWCGEPAAPMTVDEYREALKAAWLKEADR